ncbi:probable ethanolamine kinase isoform X2 [Sorghum bicolor]|uniref:probable ethanolamine kinase isoform X2 n=1 Tax=Sorghum bicolor TaxID=4558 RepID=UPI000B42366A|nr:probable ethanolamine kinase isoform X2 [Sorghum bicolor]|eukprot:XP_021310093.1 probable ethanolamine kinase isoform X2 [Sorghum bicolor]
MGSEGRAWNGAAGSSGHGGGGGGVEAKAITAALSAAEVPRMAVSVDISLPLPEMSPDIIYLCKQLVIGWCKIDSSRFSIETVSGGITNLLLKVSVKEDDGNESAVTVRLYGPNTDLVIDRKRELKAIPYLSAAGFGAQLLGIFGNGVVQSFIYARTLSPADMRDPKIAAEIAKELHKFHQVDIPGSKQPQLWNDIFKFLKKAAALKFEDNEQQKRYEKISFREIQDEVQELKDLLDTMHAPVVYAHNDLLSGNLMLNDLEGKLYFIDFEYGSYSYRGYDIANHFNEYAGLDCDYNLYPDKDAQYNFFRNYLRPDRPSEAQDMEVLYVETNTFRLASHIYWALWALIQAKVSPIDFDYLGYFFLRYGEYKKQREPCFSLAQSFLSKPRNV